MGVFDIDGLQRQKNVVWGFHGNGSLAKTHQKRVAKIVEVMQGTLDLGHNEGMRSSKFQLTNDTRVEVNITPGITDPIWKVDIHSNPEAPTVEDVPALDFPPRTACPLLPLGRPGERMFTQTFGVDLILEGNTLNEEDIASAGWTARFVPIVQTPYIVPTAEQGDYCGAGSFMEHGQIELTTPFRFAGGEFTTVFVNAGFLGFLAPQHGAEFPQSIIARDAPCTIDPVPFPVNTPDFDDLVPGNSGSIALTSNTSNRCKDLFENDCVLVEGVVIDGLEFLAAGDADSVSGRRQLERHEQEQGLTTGKATGGGFGAGASGQGEVRQFAIFHFGGGPGGTEQEIVLLYDTDLCPPAIGFFFGGEDGLHPWTYSTFPSFVNNLGSIAPCNEGVFLSARLCQVYSADTGDLTLQGPTCGLPVNTGPYIIGADRAGLAWVDGAATSQVENDSAYKNLNSRAFWFELDANGFPNGEGTHNGSLLAGDDHSATFRTTGDLGFG